MRRRLFRHEQKTLPRVVSAGSLVAATTPTGADAVPFSVTALNLSQREGESAAGSAAIRLHEQSLNVHFHTTAAVTEIVVDGFYYRFTHQQFAAAGANQNGAAELRSEIPGRVIKLLVQEGDIVEADAPLLIQEAMKMEMTLKSPARARVKEILVSPGAQVEADAVLVRFEGAGA